MRTLLTVGVTVLLAVPAAVGGALWWADRGSSDTATLGLDQQLLAQNMVADAPPLDLSAPSTPVTDTAAQPTLTELADSDRSGAVALVRQALLDDPTILEEAIEALETLRTDEENDLFAQVISDNAELLFASTHDTVIGNPEGAITLVEFLDYNCGFCKRAHQDVMRLIAENPDLRVVIKDFPVLGPGSLEAAQIAIAYRSIGGDMTGFVDAMMREESEPASADLGRRVALELGADPGALDSAMESSALMEPIAEAYGLAEQLGIRGTPAFILGQERIMGAVGFDRLVTALQVERDRLAAR